MSFFYASLFSFRLFLRLTHGTFSDGIHNNEKEEKKKKKRNSERKNKRKGLPTGI